MKLHIASDLHLDCWKNPYLIIEEFKKSSGDILILAGDLGEFRNFGCSYFREFFKTISRNYNHVLLIAGNHEFYHNFLDYEMIDKFYKNYRNFIFLELDCIELDGIHFIGTTLWSDLSRVNPLLKFRAQKEINDYRVIKMFRDCNLTCEDTHGIFEHNFEYLLETVIPNCVVITHHAPSYQSVAPKFKTNELNPFFVSDLNSFIEPSQVQLWIHGHTHNAVDYMIGNTRVVCNPLGYPNEVSNFQIKEVIL